MTDANSEEVFQELLESCDTFLFDCDGVLWQGKDAIAGAATVVNYLQNLGKQVLFVTNNSTKSRDKYVAKLSNLGFPSEKETIFGTAYTSALYLKHMAQISGKVYVVGNESMAEELETLGIECFGIGPDNTATSQDYDEVKKCILDPEVNAVLVGFDGHFSLSKLIKAASYLRDPNCLYLATNDDNRLPLGDCQHVVPGTGCIVVSVSTVAARQPDVFCGKPGRFMFNCIQKARTVDPKRTLMVGDRMNTDILFGRQSGTKTMLVLSGVETPSTLNAALQDTDTSVKEQTPDFVLPSLGEWAKFCA